MITEDFHAWLRVRIVSRLEAELLHAQLAEELVQNAHQVTQVKAAISHQPLDLVELS